MFVSKRNMIIIGVVVVVVMLAAGIGLAYAFSSLGQANANSANISATATAGAAITPTTTAHKGAHRVVGVVQSLSTSSFTLSINKGKKTITVNVDSSTKYMHNGQNAAFTDLQVGQTVAVEGTIDTATSTATATHVVISPMPKATGTATPTTTPTP